MEDRKVITFAVISVIILIIVIIIARVSLKLSRAFFLILGADVAIILAVFSCVLIRQRYKSRRNLMESRLRSEGRELRIEYSFLRKVAGVPIKFRYKELEEATDGFQALIGKGSSASVFKRELMEKREEKRSSDQKLQPLLVFNMYLVYEYIPNGSLDCWISPTNQLTNRRGVGGCLPWNLRYRVAIDVAKGLRHLQHDCRSRILHLDGWNLHLGMVKW
ncbi:PREDICTED: probable receptor-like protein kinase At5g20050 [Lupinus angustifolius]|uniref:probable receptor-like protein kinase At5g20050 n=1 Tax=Lupinus angustifolius TaxID=3871 RepID=UPI00092F6643|nr:PREDICTED: probable receptor-like protein kinase At5g20050 [Lupinus angustifolius]